MAATATARRIETVLLDAGGVLLDLDYAYLRRLLTAAGRDVSEDALALSEALARTEIERRVRHGGRTSEAWRHYFRVLLARVGAPDGEVEGIIDTLWEAHHRVGLWNRAIPGAPETVRVLRSAGFRLAVVSNAEGRVAQDLAVAGFDGLFETVVDSHEVGVEKPDPRIFRIALERLGVPPDGAMFLGDVPSVDVVGARAAGLFPVLLDRHELYPTVDAVRLRSIRELPGWLGVA